MLRPDCGVRLRLPTNHQSTRQLIVDYFDPMAKEVDEKHPQSEPDRPEKPIAKTTLYRLIEAGHLARQRLLVPLRENGLQPGDDALLFSMTDPLGMTEKQLRKLTGLDATNLRIRLVRLEQMQILERLAVGPSLKNGARLTPRGHQISKRLRDSWDLLEGALIGELSEKQKRKLRKILLRFNKLLRL